MEPTGTRREVDDLGRIVIPSTMRKTLDIGEGDELEAGLDGEQVVLRHPGGSCVFCGGADDLERFRGKAVCGRAWPPSARWIASATARPSIRSACDGMDGASRPRRRWDRHRTANQSSGCTWFHG